LSRPIKRRRPNPRLVKIHRSYTVEEIARVLGIHKNTVRMWIRNGLAMIDQHRPSLVHGLALAAFLSERRRSAKQVCQPGEIFCVRCRSPKMPAANMVDYLEITSTSGNLRGMCPDCGSLMHRRVGIAQLRVVTAKLDVTFPHALRRIGESHPPSVNCDSNKGLCTDEDAQC
jgi:hypothetical protein